MSESSQLVPLSNDQIVYRLARSRSWIDPDHGGLLPKAFELRSGESGLSVNYNCSIEEARASLNNCYGVAELNVGAIRRIDHLDVIPDTPIHAEIIGLPHKEDDEEQAAVYANLLVDISVLIWQK